MEFTSIEWLMSDLMATVEKLKNSDLTFFKIIGLHCACCDRVPLISIKGKLGLLSTNMCILPTLKFSLVV